MASETGTTVDGQRIVKNAYVGVLRRWQLPVGLQPLGGPELVVGDRLADRAQVDPDPMTMSIVFPEKDDLALKPIGRVGYTGIEDLVARLKMRVHGGAAFRPQRAETGDLSLAEFLDIGASLEFGEWSPSPQSEFVYMYGLGEVPEGTEYFSFPQLSGTAEPSVDWDRWHDLRDIMEERALTVSEQAEYQRFARIVARLDAEAARTADGALDGLVKEHEGVIASIQRLTAAVRAAAEQR